MADPAKKDDALAIAVRDAFQRHMEQARQASLAAKAATPAARSQDVNEANRDGVETPSDNPAKADGKTAARPRLEPPPAVNDLPSWLDRRGEPEGKPAAAPAAPRPFVRPLDEEWAAKPPVEPSVVVRPSPVSIPQEQLRKAPPSAPSRIDAALRMSRTTAPADEGSADDTETKASSFGRGSYQTLRAEPPLQLPRDIPAAGTGRRRRSLDTSADALALPPLEQNRSATRARSGKSPLGLLLIAGAALLLCAAIAAAVIFRGPIGDLRSTTPTGGASLTVPTTPTPSAAPKSDVTVGSTEAPSLATRSVKVVPIRLDDVDIAVQAAREHIAAGEVAHARLMLAGLQGTGDARVLMTMGESFDPAITPDPTTADVKQAIRFYEAAEKAGNAVAAERVARLAATAN